MLAKTIFSRANIKSRIKVYLNGKKANLAKFIIDAIQSFKTHFTTINFVIDLVLFLKCYIPSKPKRSWPFRGSFILWPVNSNHLSVVTYRCLPQWFKFNVLSLEVLLSSNATALSSLICYLNNCWREKKYVYAFHKSRGMKRSQ